jgi:hypothetical protein
MAKKSSGYFGISGVLGIILAIIPPTSWILGFLVRFFEGNVLAGVLRILLSFTGIGFLVIYIFDIVKMVTTGKIWHLL